MAFVVYPVGADSGFAEESALNSERDRLIASLGGRMSDFVVDPFGGDFGLTTSTSSYDVDVAAGDAFVGGHLIRSDSTVTITVDGSTTNELFLVVDNGVPDNATVTYTSDGTTPSGQYVVKLHEVTTDGSGVTGTTDFRPYIPFEGVDPNDSITGRKQGTVTGVDVSSSGQVTTTVSFDNPYRTATEHVQVTTRGLGDTGVEFGYVSVQNLTTTGFDLVVDVVNGSSGTTADFDYTAWGI